MQVFGRSSGWIKIWWNALVRSTLEKMEDPEILAVKERRFGRGYKSKIVFEFNNL